jgi:hypothetical protein
MSANASNPLASAPIRTPMFDPSTGAMTLPWQYWFLNQGSTAGGGGGGGSSTLMVVSLTVSPTEIAATAPSEDGLFLVVILEQGGNVQIAWDAAVFDPSTPVDINQDAGSSAKFTFIAQGGLWKLIALLA